MVAVSSVRKETRRLSADASDKDAPWSRRGRICGHLQILVLLLFTSSLTLAAVFTNIFLLALAFPFQGTRVAQWRLFMIIVFPAVFTAAFSITRSFCLRDQALGCWRFNSETSFKWNNLLWGGFPVFSKITSTVCSCESIIMQASLAMQLPFYCIEVKEKEFCYGMNFNKATYVGRNGRIVWNSFYWHSST